jgi:hypothetical protein
LGTERKPSLSYTTKNHTEILKIWHQVLTWVPENQNSSKRTKNLREFRFRKAGFALWKAGCPES